jgi:hypothetical protein
MSEQILPLNKVTIIGETNADAGVSVILDDMTGANLVICDTTAHIPSGKKYYNKGCILINQQTGALYLNGATVTSCTFALTTAGASGASGASGTSGATGASGAPG